MNDADIQQAELEALGNRSAKLRKQGICTHGWLQGPPKGSVGGKVVCLHCGKEFDTIEDGMNESDRMMREG